MDTYQLTDAEQTALSYLAPYMVSAWERGERDVAAMARAAFTESTRFLDGLGDGGRTAFDRDSLDALFTGYMERRGL